MAPGWLKPGPRLALAAALSLGACAAYETSPPPAERIPDPARYTDRTPITRIELDLRPARPPAAPAGDGALVQGLRDLPGRAQVITHCTACHSTALITQNRMSRARWDKTITWMQETQKLWPIPAADRAAILDFLEQTQGDAADDPRQAGDGEPTYLPNPIW